MTSIEFIKINIKNIEVQLKDTVLIYDNEIDLKLNKDSDYMLLKWELQLYQQVLKDLEKLEDIESDFRWKMLNGGK